MSKLTGLLDYLGTRLVMFIMAAMRSFSFDTDKLIDKIDQFEDDEN